MAGAVGYQQGSSSFLKKRTKKLFTMVWRRRTRWGSLRAIGKKFFGSFFKKELLPCYAVA
jgi:hypothetical protein